MKNIWLSVVSIGLAMSLTACPTMNVPSAKELTQTRQFQISVFPKQLILEASSSADITVELVDSGQPHQAILVYLDNLPNGVHAQPVTIPENTDQVKLELQTSKTYQATVTTFATVAAATNFVKSVTQLELSKPDLAQNALSDQNNIDAIFLTQTQTNANQTDLKTKNGYANFKGSLCQIMSSDRKRNIQICLTAPYEQGRIYKLVDAQHFGAQGTALLTYFEPEGGLTEGANNAAGFFWDSVDGSLTLNQVSSSLLEFQVHDAKMKPARDFERNSAFGDFIIEVNGHIEEISNL